MICSIYGGYQSNSATNLLSIHHIEKILIRSNNVGTKRIAVLRDDQAFCDAYKYSILFSPSFENLLSIKHVKPESGYYTP